MTKDKIQRKKKTAFAGFTKTKKSTTKAPSVEHVEKKPIDPGIGNSDIFFKFNTGYSNAVRQVIKIKELF